MRIRKHAKLSPLLYTSSSLPHLQTTICQLNQSPWDVVTFSPEEYSPPTTTPPPPLYHQVEEQDSYLVNGSLCDSIGALEREMKEYDTPKWGDSNGDVVVEATGGGYVDINMEDPPLEKG
ncbi:hypothetical protein Leryth_014166 [Lithospermum erythrorhizon]|nr:hypothetical protein Leryth_014166 [Lithospermum erythrorhizon]